MSGRLPTCNQPTLWDTHSATSSPASGAGLTPCGWPDGPTTGRSGPGVAPANRSRAPASSAAQPTSGTCGPCGIGSSESAALTSSLVSRLKARLPTAGSTWCAMTWKEKATPSGRSVCLLRASARRTSGTGCGSWPTPNSQENDMTPEEWSRLNAKQKAANPNLGHKQKMLSTVAQLTCWRTPTDDSNRVGPQDAMKRIAGGHTVNLQDQVTLAATTPQAADAHGSGLNQHTTSLDKMVRGHVAHGSHAETAKTGQLNPAFPRWLMGYPVAWCQAAIRMMRAMPTRRRKRG